MRKYLLLPCVAMALATLAASPSSAQNAAQDTNSDNGPIVSVELGAAELIETKTTMSVITQEVMERKNADNLSQALRMEPGIQMTGNGVGFRGSSFVNIRGFDSGRIGMFLDGIPLANAWGREFDLARISTWDMDSIEISKGYSSVLIGGVNNLGGVIDIQTAKPENPFEFKAMYKNQFDRELDDMGREFGAAIGTRQDKFYFKTSYFHKKQDFFTPSAKSEPVPGDKKGGRRSRSDTKDQQVNLMAGWTPTEDVDIMIGYFWHDAEKNSSQSWSAPGSAESRKFYWPDWNTERVYLTANIAPTENSYFKGTIYYDKHKDTLWAWDAAGSLLYNFGSIYDDKGWGTHLEYGYTFNERHKLALAANYRADEHERESYSGTMIEDLEGYNYDFGAEYTYKPAEPLTLTAGLSYAKKVGRSFSYQSVNRSDGKPSSTPKAKARNKPEHDALNWQLGAFYNLTPEHEVHFTYARKTNLPSYQQMYDQVRVIPKAGTSRLAVEIDPEVADHFEVGYKGDINSWLQLSANFFYSRVSDIIATNPDYLMNGDNPNFARYANVGNADFSGYELGLQAIASKWLTIGGNLSYLRTHRRSQSTGVSDIDGDINDWVIDKPKFMTNAYLVITPVEEWKIIPSLQAVDGRYDADGDKILSGFARVDLKTTYDLTENITLQAGVENIGDVDYGYSGTTSGGYIYIENQPGRNYYLGMTYIF